MKSAMAWIGWSLGLAMAMLVPVGMVGCSGGGEPDFGQVKHSSHLWKTDRDATLGLIRERLEQKYPDEVIGSTSSVDFSDIEGVYDIMLELVSDGSYMLHLNTGGQLLESEGSWQYYSTTSGTRVRLDPRTDATPNQQLRTTLRSWSIHIDGSGKRAVIKSLGDFETVLVRAD